MNLYGSAVIAVFIAFAEISVSSGQIVSKQNVKFKKLFVKNEVYSQQQLLINLN